MLQTLTRRQTLPIPLEAAWDFFSDPANLCRITPPWLGFRLTCPRPEPMYAGQILSYSVQGLPGLKSAWVTEITHVDRPHFFVDEQRLGPYTFWHHQHRFQALEEGIDMEDIVSYALPFGFLGDWLHSLLVKKRLDGIFDYRRQVLEQLFPAHS